MPVHGIADVGLYLRELRRKRRIAADHTAIGIGHQLTLEGAEIALHIAGLRIGAAAVQERLRVITDLSGVGIALRGVGLQD